MKYTLDTPPSSTPQKVDIDISLNDDGRIAVNHTVTGTTPIVVPPPVVEPPVVEPPVTEGYELVFERGFDTKSEITTSQGARNTLSTTITNGSKGSFRSEVRAGDAAQSSGYRGEIQFTEDAANPTEGAYEYDAYYEKVFANNGHSFQLHPHDSNMSATIALWHNGGKFQVVRQVVKDANIYGKTLQTIEAKRWYHFRWEFKMAVNRTGYVRLFIDGKLVHEETNVQTDSGKGAYVKVAVNRWKPMSGDSIMYVDNLKVYKYVGN